MTQESQISSASGSGKGRGMPPQRQNYEDNSGGHTRPFKRSSMVGIGIYQAEDGFTTLNPGMASRKVIRTGAKGTKRSKVVTGDIGYTPRQGFKWKGKSAITNSKLEKMRTEKVIQIRSAAAVKTQGKNISTRKTHVPWK
ncbi:hypothetical protein FXO38_07422 [Capsicum annuum]|nr:hypothetical protein FXO37_09766 [Capsicum annuum]KAF3669811.1 hypothetical protein FXO38_07422 [Capsicum annuum]